MEKDIYKLSGLNKYYNLLVLTASYAISKYTGLNTVRGMPFSIGIELTNNCNLGCPFCASGSGLSKRDRGYMPLELFEKISRELSPYLLKTMFYFQGESMMHPEFFAMLDAAADMGVVISTNGHFLDEDSCRRLAEARFDKIIVSIDGISESSYLKYRKNGNLMKVMRGIEMLSFELARRGRAKKLELQVLVNKYNEGELEELIKYSKRLGSRIRFKSMQMDPVTSDSDFLPRNKRYRRYDIKEGRLSIRSKKPNNCYRLWTNPVISWDGKVLPCCFDKDARYVMGDIGSQTFEEIWRGSKYIAFRKKILSERSAIDICSNCSEGLYRSVIT